MAEDIQIRLPDPIQLEPLRPYQGVEVDFGSMTMHGDPGDAYDAPVGEGDGADTFRRPYQPYDMDEKSDGVSWECLINPGYFTHTHIKNADFIGGVANASAAKVEIAEINVDGTWVPIVDDDTSGWVQPRLEVTAVTGYIYLRVHTDDHGRPKSPEDSTGQSSGQWDPVVQIVYSETEIDSTHHEPPDEDGVGIEGDYYLQIAELEDDGNGAPGIVHKGIQSNILWQEAFVPQNIGDGSNVYKEFDPDNDAISLRSVDGGYGIVDSAPGDTVDLDVNAQNQPVGTGQKIYLPLLDADATDATKMEFRMIDKGGSGRDQIDVYRKDAGTVGIRGNNVGGAITLDDTTDSTAATDKLLEVTDGLVSEITEKTIYVREYWVCDNGTPTLKKFLTLD
jgi:hypothetical protein